MDQTVTWPGWKTVRLIGRGSFGAVYEIQRTLFDETEKAALKVITIPQNASDIEELRSDGFDEESITDTFKNHLKSIVSEYSLMRKMNGCTNIVNCDDVRYVQHEDGIGWDIYIKMELLTPLTKALPDAIPEKTVIKIASDLCAALELCERFDIVHRDIKPQNIFVSDIGDYKLGDFGIAKTVEKTMGGTKIGTYKYMAPEVYNNQPYGSAADIYSLGLVLYWMLNERRMPFLPLPPAKLSAGMDETARNRRLSGEPIPAPKNGSEELKRIVLKACAYGPNERYADARLMKEALNHLSVTSEEPEEDGTVSDLNSAAAKKVPVMPPSEEMAESDATVVSPVQITNPEREGKNAPHTAPKKRKGPLIAAVCVLIGLLVGGSIFFLGKDSKQPEIAAVPTSGATTEMTTEASVREALSTPVLDITEQISTHEHTWVEATCTAPKTCSVCGDTSGSALGHQWSESTCTTPRTCSVCGDTSGSALGHQWSESTCTTPRTCSVCGDTSGSALGHQWAAATCTTPRTCSVCGDTSGSALGHQWSEATCTSAQTCQLCGDTIGKPLPHSWPDLYQNTTLCKSCGIKRHKMIEPEYIGNQDFEKRSESFLWGQSAFRRSDVSSIVFSDAIGTAPATAWDVSFARDKSILAWMNGGCLTIACDGIIGANQNSSWLFANFKNLTSIDFSDRFDTSSVTNMNAMFAGCVSIPKLNLSTFATASVTDMGGMFNDCHNLESVDVSSFDTTKVRHIQWMFGRNYKLSSVDISSFNIAKDTEADCMFYICKSLSSVILPDNLTSIGNYAFESCARLNNVIIPQGVTTIGKGAFMYCTIMSSINIPHSVTSIGQNAFNSCYKIKSVTINSRCTVGDGAFPSTCKVIRQQPTASTASENTWPTNEAASKTAMTHKEYIAADLGSTVCVETYVQAHQSWWDGKLTVYAQSEDGAYFLYNMACSEEDATKLVPGTKILVNGFKSEYAGEVEIIDATFEILNGSFIAEPRDVTELLGTSALIDHQNEFVVFRGLTVKKISFQNDKPGDDIYVTLSRGDTTVEFCVEVYLTDSDTDVYSFVSTLNVGDVVDIQGFLYWYNGPRTHITGVARIGMPRQRATDGTYSATAQGFGGEITVDVTLSGGKITDVKIEGESEFPNMGGKAVEQMPAQFIAAQSADVDGVAGASVSSNAIRSAFIDALAKAVGISLQRIPDGTFSATAQGMFGEIAVDVTLSGGKITDVKIEGKDETPSLGGIAIEQMPAQFITAQSADVDGITGATVTSKAIRSAFIDALIKTSEEAT